MVLSIFGDAIGDLLGEENIAKEETININFQPGVLLDSGMVWVKFVRKVLVAGMVVGGSSKQSKCDLICRASELPVYTEELEKSHETKICHPKQSALDKTFGSIRKSISSVLDSIANYEREVADYYTRSTEYCNSTYQYLSKDADDKTKLTVVGAGAATGFILGLRGGILRRLLFAGIGAYATASVCYSEETKEYTQQAIAHTRKYTTIGYNFVRGVKKDEPIPLPSFPEMPKMPSSVTEVWDLVTGKSSNSSVPVLPSNDCKPAAKFDETFDSSSATDGKDVDVYIDPQKVIEKSHSTTSESCHCPVGNCLGRHENEGEPVQD